MLSRRAFLALAAGAPLLPLACSPHPDEVTLQGSGATFPAPLYKRWFLEIYRRGISLGGDTLADPYHIRINYQPIGSGAGTRQFREGLTNFGASDDVKTGKNGDLARITADRPGHVQAMAVPMTAGTIVLGYNLPPLSKAGRILLLTRENLIDILLGDITEWNDERLTKLNPELKKYDKAISWVRRSDGSGTTGAFTRHLAAAHPKKWVKDGKPLSGKSIAWPVPGIGARGNDGVAAIIGQTPGALGYVEYGYAGLSNLSFAALQNRAGQFTQPKRIIDPNNPAIDGEGVKLDGDLTPDQIALGSAPLPANLIISVPDPAVKNAYPIATYTWMLVVKEYPKEKIARTIKWMLEWCLTEGQKLSESLDYVPLPASITGRVIEAVKKIGVVGPSAVS